MVRELRYRRKRCCLLALCGAAIGFGASEKWLVTFPSTASANATVVAAATTQAALATTTPIDPHLDERIKLTAKLDDLTSQIASASVAPPPSHVDADLRAAEIALAGAAQQTVIVEGDLQRATTKATEADPLLKQYLASVRDAESDLAGIPKSATAELAEARAAVEQVRTDLGNYAGADLRAKMDVARAARENKEQCKSQVVALQAEAKVAAQRAADEATERAKKLDSLHEQESTARASLAAIPIPASQPIAAATSVAPAPQEKSIAPASHFAISPITANATIFGLFGGVLATLVIGKLDRRVRMLDDLLAIAPDVRVLGPMPKAGARRGAERTESPFWEFVTTLAETSYSRNGFTVICGLGATSGRTSIAIGLASFSASEGAKTLLLDRDRKSGQLTRRLSSITVVTDTPDFSPIATATTTVASPAPRLPAGTPDSVGALFAEALLGSGDGASPTLSISSDIHSMIEAACTESAHPVQPTRAENLLIAPAVRDATARGMTTESITRFVDATRVAYPCLIADIASSGEESSILLRAADHLILNVPINTPRQSVARALTLIRERSDATITLVLDSGAPVKVSTTSPDPALPWEESDLAAKASNAIVEPEQPGVDPDHVDSIDSISDVLTPHVSNARPRKVA